MTYDSDDNLYTAEPKLLSIACFPTFFSAQISPPNYEPIMSNANYHRVPENDVGRVSMCSGPVDLDEGLLLLDPSSNGSESGGDDRALGHKFTCYPTLILRLIAILVFIPALVEFIISGCLLATISIGLAIGRNIFVISHSILCRYISVRIEFKKRDRSTRNTGKLARICPTWSKSSPFYMLLDLAVIVFLVINISIDVRVFTGFFLALLAVVFYIISLVDLGNPDNITIKGSILFGFRRGEDTVAERPAQLQVQQRINREIEEVQATGY